MRYFDKTFFKFLLGFSLIIIGGLLFVSRVEAALVNINQASTAELETLDGIGAVKAQAIIDYRNGPNGPFELLEELMEVSGIGEATFENIRGSITVGKSAGDEDGEEEQDLSSKGSGSSIRSKSNEEPDKLSVRVSGNKIGFVRVPVRFGAESNRSNLKRGNYSWSLGDGSTATGEEVEHTYLYGGEYVVVLKAESMGDEAVSRINIKIVPDTLKVTVSDSTRVEVLNDGDFEVDLFGRELVAGGRSFVFPEYTIIKPNQRISFPSSITGLSSPMGMKVALNIVDSENKFDIEAREISLEDQVKIKEIREQIASLQIRQMELRRREEDRVVENFASVSTSQNDVVDATSTENNSDSWVHTLKKFLRLK